MSNDFLAREAAVLGNNFSSSFSGGGGGGDIDFERAAAAFPDIDLDGDLPLPTSQPHTSTAPVDDFDFDFETPVHSVKVTGDDELEAFESQFPDLAGVSGLPLSRSA